MIGFFPDPYPDELLYSVCARYSERVNYPNKQSHLIELLGHRGLSAIVDFPNRLNYLISILPSGNHYSVEEIINQNTLFPFYEPFLPCDRAKLIRREMGEDSKDNLLRARIGTTVKQVKMPEYLRFCPYCVEADRKEYGETYWHRLHQLPGVLVCLIHLCFLENSFLEWKRGIGQQFFSAEKYVLRRKPRLFDEKDADHQVLMNLAENAGWLLSQNHISIENSVIRDRYYNQLLKKELAFYNGKLKNKFCEVFTDFYSPRLLKMLGCEVEKSNRNWVFRLVQNGKTDILHHPIRHFLMINFLGFASVEEFFNSFVEFKTIVDGPYPCLNRGSDHFGELRIQQCEVFDYLTKGKNKGKPAAVFVCDCGFIYQRVGPDQSEEDRFRYDSVRQHGEIWEKKLEELWNDLSLSREEISRRLKMSALSVTYHANRLKLPMNTLGARVSNDNTFRRKKVRKTFAQHREIYREEWLKVIQDFPHLHRTELLKKANHKYLWLMKNDAEWINAHMPPPLKPPKNKDFFDWKKIDKEMSMQVEKACQEIYQSVPLKRVCITEIIREVGNKKWIENRELKLPKTTQTINDKLETLEDFMIRKLKFTEAQYIAERKLPTRPQLTIRAVIRNKTADNSEIIQSEINKSLKRISQNVSYFNQ